MWIYYVIYLHSTNHPANLSRYIIEYLLCHSVRPEQLLVSDFEGSLARFPMVNPCFLMKLDEILYVEISWGKYEEMALVSHKKHRSVQKKISNEKEARESQRPTTATSRTADQVYI